MKYLKEIPAMRKDNRNADKRGQNEIPDLMFQDVKIPEALAPTPINPAVDLANQINIPRNPGPALYALDWAVPNEPLVTDESVPATPNPHTKSRREGKKAPKKKN